MKTRLLLALAVLIAAAPLFATEPVNQTRLGGVAIDGYDPVAYFVQGKPVEGSKKHEHLWNGAKWRFASAANRDLFAASPEKYAPQYGGYCAWGVSRGYAVGIDPDAWKIVAGKLYLNYNQDVQTEWSKDIPGHVKKADANWPKILAEK